MGANSKIEWCDHTFNPWYGCTKVSSACDYCYAEGWAKRSGLLTDWGKDRRRSSSSNWAQPIKWNRAAEKSSSRKRVFCASLADVFDNQVPGIWRDDLWSLIASTPNLDWLLLTKRPQNIGKMLPASLAGKFRPWPWPNVWLGTTVENQEEANRRIPALLAVSAATRFVSYEPALSAVDFTRVAGKSALSWQIFGLEPRRVDWIIVGAESGPNARPMHPDWARSVRDQCAAARVSFFMKQMTKKATIPADLLVREFPEAVR